MYKQAIETHRKSGSWYRDCHRWIYDSFRCPDLFAGLLAAMSPQVTLRYNLWLTVRAYNDFLTGREVNYEGVNGRATMPNVKRVLAGQELSGPKVRAFYANLTGDYSQVTIDGWMLKFFNFTDWMTPNRYRTLANRIQNHAVKVGLEPAELQAIVWNYQRSKEGHEPRDFVSIANENQELLF